MKYRPEIDGLRAVAVVPVILFHGGFALFSGGFVGVDVFFVISGYLISTIIMTELDAGNFTLVGFYERRARRILPALFLVILACLPFAWAWMLPARLEDFGQSIVAVVAFASNMLFWQESGYFSPSAELKPLLHTWSLAIEEQFYVVFPAFMLLCWRFGTRAVTAMVITGAIASLGLSEWLSDRDASANFYLAPTRAWELLAGVMAAIYLRRRARSGGILLGNLCSTAGLCLIALAVFVFDESTVFPSVYALLPVGGTVLIIIFATAGTWAARLLSMPPVVGIGLISYSAYLWHQPMFAFARINGFNDANQWVFGVLAVAVLPLAYLSWRLVERPFRDRARLTRHQIVRVALAASIAFAGIGSAADLTNGFRGRYSDSANALADRMRASPKRGECHAEATRPIAPSEACRYYGERVVHAVIGDSHAVELAHAFAKLVEPRGEGVLHLSYSGGLPALNLPEYPAFQKYWTEALAYLIAQEEIRNVVVIYRHSNYLMGDSDTYFPELPDYPYMPNMRGTKDEIRDRYWDSFRAFVDQLLEAGKRVVIVRPIPELGRLVSEIIYAVDLRADADFGRIAGVGRGYFDKRNAYVNGRIDAMAGPETLRMFDPASQLCDAEVCYAVRDGTPLYIDSHHVSVDGARVLAGSILKMLDELASN
jgi:peptidoglycan/LPS O-acetylase OafA/YrhL